MSAAAGGPPASPPRGSTSREAARIAATLAWVAGGVDAVGYLTLSHLFTAHMSGNSVAAGSALGQGRWDTVLERAAPIAFFVFGIWLGTLITEGRRAQGAHHPFTALYGVEAVLLGLYWAMGTFWLGGGNVDPSAGWPFYFAAAMPTIAMGLQSATVRRVGLHGVRTTYVSGVLTNLAEACAQVIARAGSSRDDDDRSPPERVRLYAGLWGAYLAGAIMSGFSQQQWGFAALALPVIGLALAAARDVQAPRELGAES